MHHWKVEWHHDFADEPVLIYNEIGDDGYEIRKVHSYRDGRILKADGHREGKHVGLGEIPVGDLADVASQPGFSAWEIGQDEFENVWKRASWDKW